MHAVFRQIQLREVSDQRNEVGTVFLSNSSGNVALLAYDIVQSSDLTVRYGWTSEHQLRCPGARREKSRVAPLVFLR